MSAIPQHSSKTVEHFTPVDVVSRARRLLGGTIDLDPASCAQANRAVKAAKIYTADDDGLIQPWFGAVMLNPPGGKMRRDAGRWVPIKAGPGESSMRVWWNKLATEYRAGSVTQAFFIGFTLEILRSSQSCAAPVQAFPRCYPRERLPFRGDQPTHANVLAYLPPREMSKREALERLIVDFGDLGFCEGGA